MNAIPTLLNRKPLPESLLLALGQLLGTRLSTSASVREHHGSDISGPAGCGCVCREP
jgi:D-lactate dehydrogenase (cytochrome)